MKHLKRIKGLWLVPVVLLLCAMLLGRKSGDVFSILYESDAFQTRGLADFTGEDVQPLAFASLTDDSVRVVTLQKSALSLSAGSYDVGFAYAGADAETVLKIYSSDYVSADNSGGIVLLSASLDPEAGYFKGQFTLEQDVNSVYIQAETRAADFAADSLRLESWAPVCTDTMFYCVLAVLCAAALLLVLNLPLRTVRPGVLGGAEVSGRRVALVSVAVCAAAVLVASLPLLDTSLVTGHDLAFHLARIEGLASALASGQLPARVHGETLNGFGYPNSYFYPELLLYFPAALKLLGVHTVTCYKIYLIFIHALTAGLSYIAFKKLTDSRTLGLTLAVVYVLNPYRLICAYYRAAVGEFTAITFLPLVLYGMYAVLKGKKKDWPWLTLGMTGILQSHILTTELTVLVCGVLALCFLPSLFGREKRVLSGIYAAGYTLLLNAWFFLPLLAMSLLIHPAVYTRTQSPVGYASYAVSYLFSTLSLTGIGPHPLGWVSLFALGFYAIYRLARGRGADAQPFASFADVLCVVALVCALATTKYFPWELCASVPVLGKLLDTIQFPYRLLTPVGAMTTALAGYCVLFWLKKREHRTLACAALVCVSVFTSCLFMEASFLDADKYPTKFYYNTNMNNSQSVGQYEYLASTASIEDIVDSCPVVTSDNATLQVSGLAHVGTTMTFHYTLDPAAEGGCQIALPLTYIPKYQVTVNGAPVEIQRTEVCRVAFDAPAAEGDVTVVYREPVLFRAFELLSLLSLAVLLLRRPLLAWLQKRLHGKAGRALQWLCA